MPQTCTICRHAQREEIEEAVTKGTALRSIAKQFNAGMSSVRRHRVNCLGRKSPWRCVACYGKLIQQQVNLYKCTGCGCTWDVSGWRKAQASK